MSRPIQKPQSVRMPVKPQPERAGLKKVCRDKETGLRLATVLPLLAVLLVVCGAQRAAPSAPLIESFSAAPATLATVEREVTLSWDIQGSATALTLEPGVGLVVGSSVRVRPTTTTTYTLTAGNAYGRHSAQTTVRLPEPKAAAPPPESALLGPWVFEIVGEKGTIVSGEIRADTASEYQGTPGVRGSVSDCRGDATFCKSARLGSIVHKPGTAVYQFGLGQRDASSTFRGKDDDGELAENTPLHFMLEGSGQIGQDERATFRVYQLGK